MESTYRYTPLSTARSTRVIEVLPARVTSAAMVIKIHETRIDQYTIPYEAVSYTWDGQIPDQPIECHQKRLYVTKNVNNILHRLRRPRTPRFIWIDAICIDQTCEQDKHRQIAMMGDVYRMAEQVVVWLGYGAPALPYLYQAIRTRLESSSCPDDLWERVLSIAPYESAPNPLSIFSVSSQTSLPDLEYMVGRALHDVLLHPYWQRAWTAQEFALNHNCLLQFYFGEISKMEFGVLLHMNKDRIEAFRVLHLGTWLAETSRSFSGRPASSIDFGFEEICFIFECLPKLRSYLPVDRVFALVSVYPRLLGNVTIDYSCKPAKVYTEAVICIIQNTGHLSILSFAGSDRGGEVAGLASWVPDWSMTRAPLPVGGTWLSDLYQGNRRRRVSDSMPLSFDGRGVKLRATKQPVRRGHGGLRDDDSGCLQPIFDSSRAFSEGILGVKGVFLAEVQDAVSDVMKDRAGVAPESDVFLHSLAAFLSACAKRFEPASLKDQFMTCMESFEKCFKDYVRWTQASDDARQEDPPIGKSVSLQESETLALRTWVGTCIDELARDPDMMECTQQHRVKSYIMRRRDSTQEFLGRSDGQLEMLKDMENRFRFITRRQRLFMTTDGILGIAERIEPGDMVALIAGCDKPFIIRQDMDTRSFKTYRLIGEAYLNGVQDGQKSPTSDGETADIYLV